jgi:enoyl-CoA hydratase
MSIQVRDVEGGLRVLTLDRPPANSINVALVKALGEAARDADRDDNVKAVILRGGPRTFSAGLDLKAMAAGELEKVKDFGFDDGLYDLWTLSKPTVAEVGGYAIAGGALLALACDVRIGARGTYTIGLNESAVGLPFPRGAFEIARASLPQMSMTEVMLRAALHTPEAAQKLGFLHEVVHPAALEARAREVAVRLAGHPHFAYAANKKLVLEPYVQRCLQEPEAQKAARHAIWTSKLVEDSFKSAVARLKKG